MRKNGNIWIRYHIISKLLRRRLSHCEFDWLTESESFPIYKEKYAVFFKKVMFSNGDEAFWKMSPFIRFYLSECICERKVTTDNKNIHFDNGDLGDGGLLGTTGVRIIIKCHQIRR